VGAAQHGVLALQPGDAQSIQAAGARALAGVDLGLADPEPQRFGADPQLGAILVMTPKAAAVGLDRLEDHPHRPARSSGGYRVAPDIAPPFPSDRASTIPRAAHLHNSAVPG
jgi:hypothetical protein